MEALLSEAHRLLLEERPAEARALLELADLDIAPVAHNAALTHELECKFDGAIEQYEAVLRRWPHSVRSMLGLANCHRHLGDRERCLHWLHTAEGEDPMWPQTHFLLSAYHAARNELEEACDHCALGLRYAAMLQASDTLHYVQCYYDPMTPSVYTMRTGAATVLDFLYSDTAPENTVLSLHKFFAQNLMAARHPRPPPRPGPRPRIGYASEAFRRGSIMDCWLPLAQNHSGAVDVFAYCLGSSGPKDGFGERAAAAARMRYSTDIEQAAAQVWASFYRHTYE